MAKRKNYSIKSKISLKFFLFDLESVLRSKLKKSVLVKNEDNFVPFLLVASDT